MSIFQFLAENLYIALALTGILGLCVGSFLNVVIHRTPLIMNREWRKDTAWFLDTQSDLDPTHVKPIGKVIANDAPISLSFPPSRCPKCNHQIRAYENIPIISWLTGRVHNRSTFHLGHLYTRSKFGRRVRTDLSVDTHRLNWY